MENLTIACEWNLRHRPIDSEQRGAEQRAQLVDANQSHTGSSIQSLTPPSATLRTSEMIGSRRPLLLARWLDRIGDAKLVR